jgi:hypothetical protein
MAPAWQVSGLKAMLQVIAFILLLLSLLAASFLIKYVSSTPLPPSAPLLLSAPLPPSVPPSPDDMFLLFLSSLVLCLLELSLLANSLGSLHSSGSGSDFVSGQVGKIKEHDCGNGR